MAHSHVLLGAGADPAELNIRRIGIADLKDALRERRRRFLRDAEPRHLPVRHLSGGRPRAGAARVRLFDRCRCSIRWRPALR